MYASTERHQARIVDSDDSAKERARARDTEREDFGADRLRVLVDSLPAMIAYVNTQERFSFCNRAYLKAFALNDSEVLGRTICEVLGEATYTPLQPYIAQALSGQMVYHERTQHWPGGASSELAVTYVPHIGGAGEVLGFHAQLVDISGRRYVEQALRQSETTLRAISDNLPALVAYVDATEVYHFANRTYEDWFGLRPDQVVGHSLCEVLGSDYSRAKPYIDEALSGQRAVHERDVLAKATHRHLHNIYIPRFDPDGEVAGFCILATDISERKALEDELLHRASHDPLTGLPNRALLLDRLEQALERSKRHRTPVAAMYIDIDYFKAINDTFGHQVGDDVLRGFAGRLAKCVRTIDTVARIGGDEFVILLEELEGKYDAALVARKVLASTRARFDLAGATVPITASIGLAISAPGDSEARALLGRADAALYRAKADGRNQWRLAA